MTSDPASAEAFYSKAVGWKAKSWDQDPSYKMWTAGGKPMGGLMAVPEVLNATPPPPQWFSYIGTPDVDATVRQAVELGGKVMRPAQDIPTVGRFAFLNDPQGAAFAAYAPSTAPKISDQYELGDFSWHELLTTNAPAAWEFYHKLFGWMKTGSMDMGGGNMYQMFGIGGIPFGGMFTRPAQSPGPPMWLPYALVRDSKRAAETIKQHGGTVINGPMEVPGGDWIVAGLDREGVAFAVHSKKPVATAAKPAASAAKPAKKGATLAKGASGLPRRSREAAKAGAKGVKKKSAAKNPAAKKPAGKTKKAKSAKRKRR